MKANESKVEDFLSSNKTQFVIPVYQRNYDWTIPQCKQLLDDILEVGRITKKNAHFIGSIVYIHDDVYTSSRIKELTIIDGQQRLTTLTLIYIALYRLAIECGDKSLEHEINETFLINKFAAEEERLKLRPTENNDKAIKFLLYNTPGEQFKGYSRIIDNFDYFKSRIVKENLNTVLEGLSKLLFVEISLERGKDDPQRIFESLNSTGLELTQADLIRNYILMGLNPRDQIRIYQNFWKIIEQNAKDESSNKSKVSEFIRDFLTLENKKIPNKSKVYEEFKLKYPTSTLQILEKTLLKLKSLVPHYNKLINPENEVDKDIQQQLKYISKLEVNVAHPFLLQVYDDYYQKFIDKKTFIEILELIQSFIWRRFTLGLPTNALNKIFMTLYNREDQENYLYSIEKNLLQKTGSQRFPRNQEIKDAMKIKDVYNINSKNRIYLFDRLENHNNHEKVIVAGNPDITIEHIFPQKPDIKWRKELSEEEFKFIEENYLHTIGNLTLSGNNGSLGNKNFISKRDMPEKGYRDSRLWLNRNLKNIKQWNRKEIENRFNLIINRFFEIWPIPEINIEEIERTDEVNIFEADSPKGKKLEYAIFFGNKIQEKQVAKLYAEVIKQLFDLEPERFFTTDLGERIGMTKNPTEGNPRQAITINESYVIEGNIDNVGKFDRMKEALRVFELEDELTIKYAH